MFYMTCLLSGRHVFSGKNIVPERMAGSQFSFNFTKKIYLKGEKMNKKDILELIIRHIYEVIPELEGQLIKSSDRLVELGANSVDRAEIVAMAMDSLSLQIPRVELFGAKNIGELVDVLYEKSKSA